MPAHAFSTSTPKSRAEGSSPSAPAILGKPKRYLGKKPRNHAVFCCLFLHPAKTLDLCGIKPYFLPFVPCFVPYRLPTRDSFIPRLPTCPAAWRSLSWNPFQREHRHSWLYECQRAPAALVHPWGSRRLPAGYLYKCGEADGSGSVPGQAATY